MLLVFIIVIIVIGSIIVIVLIMVVIIVSIINTTIITTMRIPCSSIHFVFCPSFPAGHQLRSLGSRIFSDHKQPKLCWKMTRVLSCWMCRPLDKFVRTCIIH